MRRVAVLAAVLAGAAAFADDTVVLQTSEAVATFGKTDELFGNLVGFQLNNGPQLIDGSNRAGMWTASFVDPSESMLTGSPLSCSAGGVTQADKQSATFVWKCTAGQASANVSVVAAFQGTRDLHFNLVFKGTGSVGLWDWSFTVNRVALKPSSSILENHGFGILHECGPQSAQKSGSDDAAACTWSAEYKDMYIPGCPGGGSSGCPSYPDLASAQASCVSNQECTGVTFSAGQYQLRGGNDIEASPSGENSWRIANVASCHSNAPVSCSGFKNDYPSFTATYQFLSAQDPSRKGSGLYFGVHDGSAASKTFAMNVDSSSNTVQMAVSAVVPNAGVKLTEYQVEYPFVLVPFDGDWWDAAQIYRTWVTTGADWTKKGSIQQRSDFPKWLLNVTTWVNSHWQGNDIFNISGGDPKVVRENVLAVQEKFALDKPAQMGLHWYEWDTLGYELGSNYTKCTSEETCGFDTHYPEYFPARQGFSDTMAALRAAGVRVAPYINGRIFDVGTKSWTADGAQRFAAKYFNYPGYEQNPSELQVYEESYGSHAVFNAMCPHTKYWQEKLSNVTAEIVNTLKTDGVYMDQIASAGSRPCWDKSHGHAVGGGNHWVSGYRTMLQSARSRVGNNAVFLTESNAECFMDGMNIYLSLTGYSSAPFVGSTRMVNAFTAIYGGYFISMGAEFYQQDFAPNPDVFSAKNAQMLVFGSQLGWYSLLGRDNQYPAMGVMNYLLDDQYAPEIAYLRLLSRVRLASLDWLVNGRAARELKLEMDGTRFEHNTHPRGTRHIYQEGIAYDPIMHQCFIRDHTGAPSTLLCILTTPKRQDTHTFTLRMPDPTMFGLKSSPIDATDLLSGATLGTFGGPITISQQLKPHSVLVIKFTPQG